jgi:glycosyltransferase involved in cell wall biosynthesis
LRIGYLIQNNAPDLSVISGPQLHTVAVIECLRKLGHEVRTLATQRGRLVWSDDLTHWSDARYRVSRAPWFRAIERPIRRVQAELHLPFIGVFNSERYADACLQHLTGFHLLYERHGYMGYGGVIAARRLGIPHVLELNGNIVKEIDTMGLAMSSVQRKIGWQITKRTLLATDHVVVVSEALKRELVSALGIPAGKISVVLNGVDVALFERTFDVQQIRASYGLTLGPSVLFVGSFQPWHGVDLLVAAFAEVRRCLPDTQLVLIGDGDGRSAVETQIAGLGLQTGVRMLGRLPQEKVAAVLSTADVVVAPYPFTHGEIVGTPLKLLEYMAAGKAIVASTAPIHEIVQHGVTGIRVAPANAHALACGIAELLADDRQRAQLGANARRLAQDYSWEQVVNRLCDVFDTVLSERPRSAPKRRTVEAHANQ